MQGASSLILLVVLVGIFYFLLIRPQKRRVEQHQSLVGSVDVGDEIVTIGGIYGTVRSIGDDEMELEVAPGTTIRFSKSAISRRLTEDVDDEGDDDEYVDATEEDDNS